MNITELLITGYDGARTLFAATLTTDGVKVVKPGTGEEGQTTVGERWEKTTTAFTAVQDLMIDLVSTPTPVQHKIH